MTASTCPRCRRTSHHPIDAIEGYCGACKAYTSRVYVGIGGRHAVVIVDQLGNHRGPLRHIRQHSPTGFGWGYGGSGPADLARSMLIDALGADAACATCAGRGKTCFRVGDGAEVPLPGEPLRLELESAGPCTECAGSGYGPHVERLYQRFKFDRIAKLPQDEGWRITVSEVLGWVSTQLLEERA